MTAVYFDRSLTDEQRRLGLYGGDLFVYSGSDPAGDLSRLAREMLKTYFDVPRLRTSTSDDYLTSGIAFAFHPHRDTWYSAPLNQINWWLPVYDIGPDNGLAIHPHYWQRPLKNGSRNYDYQKWQRTSRKEAAKHVRRDTRKQPTPEEEVELEPQLRSICPVGGSILFSAAQLHSSVPNASGRTRVSIDFRTVDIDDVAAGIGAPNRDSECTGTTLRDYLRASDFEPMDEQIAQKHDAGRPAPELSTALHQAQAVE